MLRSFTRRLATAATRTTVLPNGLTVATENIPHSMTATVGVWIDAGSRADVTDVTSGTAHFLEHLAFKGTKSRSQLDLELEVENCGSHLNAYTSRENTVYYAKSLQEDIPRAVNILSDILTRSKLEKNAIEKERPVIIRESEEVDKMYDEVIFDRLHEVVFKDQPLGRTILGPLDSIRTIKQDDLKNYIKTNYKGDRMVLVGAGCVDHEEMVRLALENFGHVPLSEKPLPLGTPRTGLPVFKKGDWRSDEPSLPNTYLAITVEGCSWSSKDYFRALVAQAIVGNWDRATNAGASPLAKKVLENGPLCNSFMSFSTSYSDIGLWGMYIVLGKDVNVKLMIDEVLNEWNRLKDGKIENEEIESAKNQLKGSLLLGLDGTTAIAEDIGRQLVTTGKRLDVDEIVQLVDNITKEDVVDWCQKYLKNKPIGMASMGNIDSVPTVDYIMKKLA
ncbi:mitochondrial processing peptidase [Martiniozyma asiatica (nom. inval.)]|nr:mitochondrial processing peptidase [Martiniozyma asiatica]